MDYDIVNLCFNCGEECNPCSQVCGACARNPARSAALHDESDSEGESESDSEGDSEGDSESESWNFYYNGVLFSEEYFREFVSASFSRAEITVDPMTCGVLDLAVLTGASLLSQD